MGRDQGYVHLQKEEQIRGERDNEEKVRERRQEREDVPLLSHNGLHLCRLVHFTSFELQ